ncbi:MAG: biotin/lipoyl-containing protein [Pirellulales bacterium]|nr:biotin/lipoyl-binding protein [Planctomycetales bacterium]
MKKLRITIDNKSYDVTVEDLTETDIFGSSPSPASAPSSAPATPTASAPTGSAAPRPKLPMEAGTVTSPMAGAIKSVLVKPGDQVKEHQALVILEAMKMENQITAPVAGAVKSVAVKEGDSVHEGQVLVVVE